MRTYIVTIEQLRQVHFKPGAHQDGIAEYVYPITADEWSMIFTPRQTLFDLLDFFCYYSWSPFPPSRTPRRFHAHHRHFPVWTDLQARV
jgi:hypothetical protein